MSAAGRSRPERMARIGIFGGSFNPPHQGHLAAARAFRDELGLAKVIFIPAAIPPHKQLSLCSAPPRERVRLTQLTIQEEAGFAVSDLELRRGGTSYTVDTLRQLRKDYPCDELYLLMGTDMFLSFDQWREPEEMARFAVLVCAARTERTPSLAAQLQEKAAQLKKSLGARTVLLSNRALALSSTEVRRSLFFDVADGMLAPEALREIREKRLYGCAERFAALPLAELTQKSLALHKQSRRAHALGVQQTAQALALRFGEDAALAARAGILHDVTKALSNAQQRAYCAKYAVPVTDFELQNAQLLHAKTGADAARRFFGECTVVCEAIRWHTTGKPAMSGLEKIVFLADLIEPSRDYAQVQALRRGAQQESLDGAVLLAMERTLSHLAEEEQPVCADTIRARDYLLSRAE